MLNDIANDYQLANITWHYDLYRHPDPRSRPQFGQITKLLAGNTGYLLGWSDEDKQIGDKDAMKLGAPLESANDLYYDLQLQYKQTES